jgi:AmmeMemoRadiSam system protein A
MVINPSQQAAILGLARNAILAQLQRRSYAIPPTTDPLLNMPCGCFVTLHSTSHQLRGCIGRIQSSEPLYVNIHNSALGAIEDPRFTYNPITLEELPRLTLEVSVLSPLEEAKSTTDFELLEHGIVLMAEGRSGTFLPQVARETGWTKEQLLTRLCGEKMGVAPDAWKMPSAVLYRYSATIVGPVPFLEQPAGGASGLGGNRFVM